MAAQTSRITEQKHCIYLTVDETVPIQELLDEAKELAVRENTMVMFAIFTYGRVFQVTRYSDVDRMLLKFHDRFNCEMVIN